MNSFYFHNFFLDIYVYPDKLPELKKNGEKTTYIFLASQMNEKWNFHLIITEIKIKHIEENRRKATLEWSVVNGLWLALAFELRDRF